MPISDQIADRVTGHSINLLRFDVGTRRKARNLLKELEIDIISNMERVGLTEARRQSTRYRRLETLLENTKESVRGSYVAIRRETKKHLLELADVEPEALTLQVNKTLGVDVFTSTPSPETLRALVNNTLVEGTPLNQWWDGQSRNLRRRFEGQMRLGIASGEDLQQLRRRIRGDHTGRFETITLKSGKKRRVGVFSGGIMDTTKREADALIRTASQSVSNGVRDETLSNNSDVVKGRQALSTLDNRTSPICIARSGFAWNLDGTPISKSGANIQFPGSPPWHVNCRTTLIPILRSFAELAGPRSKIGKRKLERLESAGLRVQRSMDGLVASDLNYEQWLKTKSKAFQVDVLGKRRYGLWKEGKIKSLSQLVNQEGRVLTLDQLIARI